MVFFLLALGACSLYAYAFLYNHAYFNVLTLGCGACLIYLLRIQQHLAEFRAGIESRRQEFVEKANLLDGEINKEWQSIEAYCKKILNYSQLKGLTEKLCAHLSLQETMDVLTSEVDRVFGEKEITVILYLFHSRTGELGLSCSQKGQMRINIKAKQGDIYDQWVVKVMKPLLVEDTRSDFRFDAETAEAERSRPVRSLMSVPLVIGSKAIGILRVDSPQTGTFSTEDIRFLNTIGDLGAVAVENAQLYERIEDLAIRDSLTGLYLRRHLLDRLNQELSRQLRRKRDLSFLMLDLDEFKNYNDRFGHPAGDLVLKAVGKILSAQFSEPGQFVCRYGGEEFSVVLPDCSKEQALTMAEDLRRQIEQEPILLRRQSTHITVSIGVATFPDDAQLKEELIGKADFALYKAKNDGRNCVRGV